MPRFPDLTEDQISFVIEAVKEKLDEAERDEDAKMVYVLEELMEKLGDWK